MSGVSTSVSGAGPAPDFLSLRGETSAARQSATAATSTAASTGSAASHAFGHLRRRLHLPPGRTPGGASSPVGPGDQRHLRAQRLQGGGERRSPGARWSGWRGSAPGSIGSCVGPAVTSTRRPASGPRGLAPRAWPAPPAGSPAARPCGPDRTRRRPSPPRRVPPSARRRRAGARRCGAWPGGSTCARSWPAPSARACRWPGAWWRRGRRPRPLAALAIRSAVAGAATIRSAQRESWMWPISASSVSDHRSSCTGWPLSDASDRGVTNSRPPRVRIGAHAQARLAQQAHELERLEGRHPARHDQEDAARHPKPPGWRPP